MRRTGWICALAALALGPPATAQNAPDPAAFNDAVSWASGLRDRLRRMTDPVVDAYGIASLGSLVCPLDKGLGADLFREAVGDLNNLPANVFQDSRKVLPVATFSGLWKHIVGPGLKCDLSLPLPGDHARERRDAERRQASSYLAQAKFTDDYDRSAQLARAALEAGDPNQLDITPVTDFLIQFRMPAPDLADDVFQRAIDFATASEIPSVDILADLGNYLFLGAAYLGRSEPVLNRTSYSLNGSAFWNWAGSHDNANPDLVTAYIGAAAQLLSRQDAANLDPVAAYSLAYQLLPKARDLELDDAGTLQKIVDQLQAQNGRVAAAVEARLGSAGGTGQSNFARLMARIRAAIAAAKFVQARELLPNVDGVGLRSQVASLIDFFEAAHAIGEKDADRALALSSQLPAGVKRSLLYAGIVATAANRTTALSVLHLGLKDADLLSYEQRMSILSALAAACRKVDPDETQAVLGLLIAAHNDASVSPRKSRFDPKTSGAFDGTRVLFGSGGVVETVEGRQGRQSFSLKVPGVTAFSLDGFIAQAKDMDFPRLVTTVEGLHNELHLTKAYLALAGMRLKAASR